MDLYYGGGSSKLSMFVRLVERLQGNRTFTSSRQAECECVHMREEKDIKTLEMTERKNTCRKKTES